MPLLGRMSQFVTVSSLSNTVAATYPLAQVAFYATGKDYFGTTYNWFIVRNINGTKKFVPIGLTMIYTDDNGVNVYDPDTEQYILTRTWTQIGV